MSVLFPVETIKRELDFKLFLAVMFASRHRRIFIGQHDSIHALVGSLKHGIYLGKNIFLTSPPAELRRYRDLKRFGFQIIYLDEEGAFYTGQEDDWSRALRERFDARVFDSSDLLCMWGDFQKRHCVEVNPSLKDSVVTTGHPRFDLYKPQYRDYFREGVEELRKRHGEFVLINTNFGTANHGLGSEYVFSWIRKSNQDERRRLVKGWAHTSKILANFVVLVHEMAQERPGTLFVLRPHPSEDHHFYASTFEGLANVKVLHSGPVAPWLMAAEVLIHNGCTTAVEAHLAGTPVITYRPVQDARYDVFVPNAIGRTCHTVKEVLEALDVARPPSGNDASEMSSRAHDLFYNFSGDSFDEVLSVLRTAEEWVGSSSDRLPLWLVAMEHLSRRVASRIRDPVRRLVPSKRRRLNYHRNKFPGFEREVIEEKIRRIEETLDKRVSHRVVSDHLMIVEAT